ncbi:MAG: TonB-dependent receptor [Steroidobacteraceae bacterium]|nr:TonB-dependent receptor [Steroidobacteraceae bacterium]
MSAILRRNALFAGVPAMMFAAAATMGAAPAHAQGAGAETLEEIVVTGSRIRREALSDAPSPTVSVGAEEIAERQFTNVIDALDELQLGSVSTNRGANTQFGDNYAFVNLLNVGSQRTLTLLNGRRVVPSNQGTVFVPGNASGAQVDLSLFNPYIVERVEVITGTGGAVYGADAVAGVVNIITKQNFEGFNVDVSGGITELDSETSYRVSAIWGTNLFDDRLNFTVTGEYYNADLIRTSAENAARYQGAPITNQLNGATRDPNPFNAQAAADTLRNGGTLNPVFVGAGGDGVRATAYGPLALANPLISLGGVLHSGPALTGATTATQFLPTLASQVPAGFGAAADPQGLAFFAPGALTAAQTANPAAVISTLAPGTDITGLNVVQQRTLALQLLQRGRPTPWEYATANPSINPLLFVGAFGGTGTYPTIANPDPATAALFPRVAVPLQFDSGGNLVPFRIGDLLPPNQARVGSAFNGDGYDSFALGHQQTRSDVERAAFMGQHSFEITDNIRWSGEYLYSDITFSSIGGTQSNTPAGSATAGSFSIPVYIDQNPFLTSSARGTIDGLVAQGLAVPTIGGQRALFLGRALADVMGGGTETANEVQTWRIAQALEGDFEAFGQPFYWDVAAAYGEAEATNRNAQLLDIEFALAVDVVQGPNGPVCYQQTLAAPESIAIRNPRMANINTLLSLVPTAEQVANCKPLNLFGNGAPSPEAIDYVRTDGGTTNKNTQEYYSASLGGDLFELPAGPFSVNVQGEFRKESIEFKPGAAASVGAARNTTIRANSGELEFTEYGFEARMPIFGRDFTYPLLRALELDYAWRAVEREQSTESEFYPDPGPAVEDDVFSVGFRWKPFEDLTIRGTRAESVRSASLVELFSAPSSGFGNFSGTACGSQDGNGFYTSIDSGANPEVRRANCIAAVQALGIAATPAEAEAFLASFVTSNTPGRPAAATGNPFLQNEQGRSWTIGFTWQPSFAPTFSVGLDYIDLEIKQEIGLYSPFNYIQNCFDSTDFPNTLVSGTPVCDLFTFGVQGPGGNYIIPAVNPLTGNPVAGGAPTGSPAPVQGPFETAFFQFPNFNLGKRELKAYNLELRYSFDLGVFGETASNWGGIFLRGSVFKNDMLDLYADGVNKSDQLDGEPAAPEWLTRLDVTHRVGNFAHTLQWFWRDETVDNILLPGNQEPEQSPAFVNPAYSFFNYNAQYALRDNITLRLTVNNVTDTDGPNGRYGDAYDLGIGREWILGVGMQF